MNQSWSWFFYIFHVGVGGGDRSSTESNCIISVTTEGKNALAPWGSEKGHPSLVAEMIFQRRAHLSGCEMGHGT